MYDEFVDKAEELLDFAEKSEAKKKKQLLDRGGNKPMKHKYKKLDANESQAYEYIDAELRQQRKDTTVKRQQELSEYQH
jgi:hypothetical protein